MRTSAKIAAAALGLLLTGTVAATHVVHPLAGKKTVRIVHRIHRPHLAVIRALPGHRLAPRIEVARAVAAKRVVKTTVIR